MCSSKISCLEYFTSDQGNRMRQFIANHPSLKNVSVPKNVDIDSVYYDFDKEFYVDAVDAISV